MVSQLSFSAETSSTLERSRLWLLSMKDRKVEPFGTDGRARSDDFSRWPLGCVRDTSGGSSQRQADRCSWSLFHGRSPDTYLPQPGVTSDVVADGRGVNHQLPGSEPRDAGNEVAHVRVRPIAGSPTEGTSWRRIRSAGRRQGDMMPDGRVIGIMSPTGSTQSTTKILVVLNWFDEVRQRVPKP